MIKLFKNLGPFKRPSVKALAFMAFYVLAASCSTVTVTPDGTRHSGTVVNKATNSFKVTPNKKKESQRPLFDWPVWEARMTRGFLPKGTRRGSKRPHYGIDLAAQRGVAVMSSHDGIVIYTGKEFRGFGKMIMIETYGDKPEYATIYAHLDKIVVYQGQRVKQGEVIGALGNTGRSSGPHLHFEIRKPDGTKLDPLNFLPAGKELTNNVDDPSAPNED